jgi:threonine dehydrogenase-like Zn-dependent dehydrogenase
MRAVGLDYDSRTLIAREVPEPAPPQADEVLFRLRQVGVCGTDRDLAQFHFGEPPQGERFLTLGHEAFGQVVECGSNVTSVRPSDWLVPTVRRPCAPACSSCARGRADLCVRGTYTERGILGLHGYFRDYAVDREEHVVAIPESVADVAVLLEPLSVVEKAVATALQVHEPGAAYAVVLGAGTVGILAALLLQLHGLRTSLRSLEPPDSARATLIQSAGIEYGGEAKADILIEATGSPAAILGGIEMLAPLGVMVVLGAAEAEGRISFRRMVVENQMVLGSVNASPEAWRRAAGDLPRMPRNILSRLIHRVPFDRFAETILSPQSVSGAPKLVHMLD